MLNLTFFDALSKRQIYFSKTGLFAWFFLLFVSKTSAQSLIQQSTGSLVFAETLETQPDSLPLTLTNIGNRTVVIQGFGFFETFGGPAFSVSTSPFTLAAFADSTIYVYFLPRQNMFHNSEMLIYTNEQRGALRVDLRGQGKFSNTYYDTTQNLEGEALKSALRWRTGQGYVTRSYNEARDFMFMEIDNQRLNGQGASQNTLECVYTGRLAVGYASRSAAQSSNNFNTEHTYPQSLFSSNLPMQSDLHHLFPTDETANSIRSNNPFGVVGTFTWSQGGSKGNSNTFEPRDAHKGRGARALLYFGLRYRATAGVNFSWLTPQETVLRNWHYAFPPNIVDSRRNQAVFNRQLNRNPLVDYPQFLDRINNIVNTATSTIVRSFETSDTTIDFGLVQSGFSELYRVWLVNTGNFPLQITNIQNTGSGSFSLLSANNLTIASGEAAAIEIEFNSDGNAAFGSLAFSTNIPGTGIFTYPIVGNGSTGGIVNNTRFGYLNAYPNPITNGLLLIESPFTLNESQNFDLRIFDITGKVINTGQLSWATDKIGVSTDGLSAGVYQILLQTKDRQQSYTTKFVKQP